MKMRWLAVAAFLGLASCKCAGTVPASRPDATNPVQDSGQALSLVVTAARPAGGEYFGLYLMDKKVGYIFTDFALIPDRPEHARSITETVFKANVGGKPSERRHKETRVYEAKPRGRLVSLLIEQQGDGGNQTLEGTVTSTGLQVIRKRPDAPNQVINLPVPQETVEDADQVRFALATGRPVNGYSTHAMDLETYGLKTHLEGEESRMLGGVKVALRKAVTVSEKEKVPMEAYVDDKGRVVEIHFGSTMRAVAESEPVAKRLDQVEVFGLTRIVLPEPPPPSAKEVPGKLTLVMSGLPEKFHVPSYRQSFKRLADGNVEVTLRAVLPKEKKAPRPVKDPAGGQYLKTSIIVESDSPEIRDLAEQIVGTEADALVATRKINRWVYENLVKDYGASADRATDVLRQKRGDCTEHSLLMVALLRAAGIPARRVDGVIYMMNDDQVPALYWHEWVEAWVGEWTQLDPTFGQDVADATHFAVGEEGNAEITPLIGQLKVLAVR